jgi:hypothetical protein
MLPGQLAAGASSRRQPERLELIDIPHSIALVEQMSW